MLTFLWERNEARRISKKVEPGKTSGNTGTKTEHSSPNRKRC